MIAFTVYGRAEPQGSSRAWVKNGKAHVTSANKKLKPWRQMLTQVAVCEATALGSMPLAGKHIPVRLTLDCYFERPPSIPKKRTHMVVKPDADKLLRAANDALTGVLYADDAQVVDARVRKHYGSPERVEIRMERITE